MQYRKFFVPGICLSISVPADWTVHAQGSIQMNRERLAETCDVGEWIKDRARIPSLAATRFAECEDDVNPTLQIGFRPFAEPGPRESLDLLRGTLMLLEGSFEEYALLGGPEECPLAGENASYARAAYTVGHLNGVPLRVVSRSWILTVGSFFMMVGMSGPEAGPYVSEEEFREIGGRLSFDAAGRVGEN